MLFKLMKFFSAMVLSLSMLATSADEETKTYLEPQDISDSQWQQINGKIRVYNACLKEEMVNWVDKGTDPRRISDTVLDICSVHLLELEQQMAEKNINPEYTKRFIYANKNKSAKKMLSSIMIIMSQKAHQANQNTTPSTKEPNTKAAKEPTTPKVTIINQN